MIRSDIGSVSEFDTAYAAMSGGNVVSLNVASDGVVAETKGVRV